MKKYNNCIQCEKKFTEKNVFTKEGWKETQISGICESCFDNLFYTEEQYFEDIDNEENNKEIEPF